MAGPGKARRVTCFHAGSAPCGHFRPPQGTLVVKAASLMVEVRQKYHHGVLPEPGVESRKASQGITVLQRGWKRLGWGK